METKFCNFCDLSKPLDDFTKRSDLPGGKNYCCRDCGKNKRNSWYKKHSKREAARAKRYRENLPPEVLKERKRLEAIKHAERRFNNQLMWRYKLPRTRYDALLVFQGHRCAVCKVNKAGGRGRWHVDHDHACCPGKFSCGKCIRGLLCHGCNIGVGALGNNSRSPF